MAGEYAGSAGRVPVDKNGTAVTDETATAIRVLSVDSTGTAQSGTNPRYETITGATGVVMATLSTNAMWSGTAPEWARRLRFIIRATAFSGAPNLRPEVGISDASVGGVFSGVGSTYARSGTARSMAATGSTIIIEIVDSIGAATESTANNVYTMLSGMYLARGTSTNSISLTGTGGGTLTCSWTLIACSE